MYNIDEIVNKVHCRNCIDFMKQIPDNCIDMILCDLPYGVTQNKDDKVIDLNLLWEQYKKLIKEKGVIALTSQQPFTTDLINSNREMFRYDLVWNKILVSGFLNAKRMPLRVHEHILIFYKKLGVYNPQFTYGEPLHSKGVNYKNKEIKNRNYGKFIQKDDLRKGSREKYPTSILRISKYHPSIQVHPTQKPVALFEYLIKTYTNEDDLVLDNCAGSGTTGIACKNINRNYILIEKEQRYCEITKDRLRNIPESLF